LICRSDTPSASAASATVSSIRPVLLIAPSAHTPSSPAHTTVLPAAHPGTEAHTVHHSASACSHYKADCPTAVDHGNGP
jgi:hypothetical protein